MKMGAFTALLLFFGCYGLFDATYAYPKRGMADMSSKFTDYLKKAREAAKLNPPGVRVEDPKAAYGELTKRNGEFRDTAEGRFEAAKFRWLESLKVLWRLKAEPIVVGEGKGMTGSAATGASGNGAGGTAGGSGAAGGPNETSGGVGSASGAGGTGGAGAGGGATAKADAEVVRTLYFDIASGSAYALEGPSKMRVDVSLGGLLDELDKKWARTNQTQPLSGFDLAVQWLFVVIGFGAGLYLLVVILRAAATRYRWDAEAKRLTLPGGRAIVAADLKDVDKRRWHKFYVTLLLNDGTSHALDLYRFDPLEQWVLELERAAFPDRPPPATPASSSPAAGSDSSGGTADGGEQSGAR
jgi:hypothetical protein